MTAVNFDTRDGLELAAFSVGLLGTLGATYYTGMTGDPVPLSLAAGALGALLVVTTDYEKLEE